MLPKTNMDVVPTDPRVEPENDVAETSRLRVVPCAGWDYIIRKLARVSSLMTWTGRFRISFLVRESPTHDAIEHSQPDERQGHPRRADGSPFLIVINDVIAGFRHAPRERGTGETT
jgi:hypothetical protein